MDFESFIYFKQISTFQLKVIAKDGGMPSRIDEGFVEINVLDCNDNSPIFQHPTNGSMMTTNIFDRNPFTRIYVRHLYFFAIF